MGSHANYLTVLIRAGDLSLDLCLHFVLASDVVAHRYRVA